MNIKVEGKGLQSVDFVMNGGGGDIPYKLNLMTFKGWLYQQNNCMRTDDHFCLCISGNSKIQLIYPVSS